MEYVHTACGSESFVNGDGNVVLNDATAVQKYVADLITEFENGKVSVFN